MMGRGLSGAEPTNESQCGLGGPSLGRGSGLFSYKRMAALGQAGGP